MTPGARAQAAVELLDAVAEAAAADGLPADRVVRGYFRARRYAGSKDRAAAAAVVYAVLRRRAQLDWWIGRAGLAPTSRLRVFAALRACLGWSADAVAAAADGSRHGPAPLSAAEAALVESLPCGDPADAAQPPWVRANVPEWLAPHLEAGLGADWAEEAAALAAEASVDLRVNTLRGGRDEALAMLTEAGIAAAPTPHAPHGLRLTGRADLAATPAYKAGLVEPQDEASQLVALLLEARPGEAACDYCAGGGGKTLALAAAMGGRGRIAACDVAPARLAAMTPRLARAGAGIVAVHRLPDETPSGPFDRVLVDAPCSGVGAWRRNPDARWRLTLDGLARLCARQREILDAAAALVRPGGRLVYATCSFLGCENQEQVTGFTDRHPGFELVPVEPILVRSGLGGDFAGGPYFLATPARHGTDGFFAAALRRAG